MRRPHLSTGAWIFATAGLVLAVAAPVSYAAVSSTVAIGNASGSTTALVDPEKQLLTNAASPKNMVHVVAGADANACTTLYTPPAGKAIVVTNATFDMGTGTAGDESYGTLASAGCGTFYDTADTTQGYDTEARTYPAGLPMPSVAFDDAIGNQSVVVSVTGYLIPAGELPAATAASHAEKAAMRLKIGDATR